MVRQHRRVTGCPQGLVHDRLNSRYLSNHAYLWKWFHHYGLLAKIRYQHWNSPSRWVHQRPAHHQARVFHENRETLQKATGRQQPATHCMCGTMQYRLRTWWNGTMSHREDVARQCGVPAVQLKGYTSLCKQQSFLDIQGMWQYWSQRIRPNNSICAQIAHQNGKLRPEPQKRHHTRRTYQDLDLWTIGASQPPGHGSQHTHRCPSSH